MCIVSFSPISYPCFLSLLLYYPIPALCWRGKCRKLLKGNPQFFSEHPVFQCFLLSEPQSSNYVYMYLTLPSSTSLSSFSYYPPPHSRTPIPSAPFSSPPLPTKPIPSLKLSIMAACVDVSRRFHARETQVISSQAINNQYPHSTTKKGQQS